MVYFTAVHMVTGGTGHEHIASLRWRDPANGQVDVSTTGTLVDWIEKGNIAKVQSGLKEVQVGVVNATPKYLRTYADGVWTDNLLALPRF